MNAGVDVFRLNFSHGDYEHHKQVIENVRRTNQQLGTHTCLLQDLQGPKIRIEEIKNGEVEIESGDPLTITTENVLGDKNIVSTTYKNLASDVEVGNTILIDVKTVHVYSDSKKHCKKTLTKLQQKLGVKLLGFNPETRELKFIEHRNEK